MKWCIKFLGFLIIAVPSFCQKDWKLIKEKNGIKVYMRDCGKEGLKELKGVTIMKSVSLHTIAAVFKDVESQRHWSKDLKLSNTIKVISETEDFEYFEVQVPWPIKNRDVIYHSKISQDPKDMSLNIIGYSRPDLIPEKPGIVRIKDSHGSWKFTPRPNGTMEVQNQLYADPVGFPSWLVNLIAVDGPMDLIVHFKEFIKHPKYKNIKFGFIKE